MTYLAIFINIFFSLLNLAILIRVLLSWVQVDRYHPAVVFIHDVTEPILSFIKKIIPPIGMLDLSPMIAMIGLDALRNILIYFLNQLSL